jgi:hypothetical protein
MKGSYIEEVAIRGGPDHALATREGAAKRWIGVHAGRLLSLEISESGVPTWSDTTEGNIAGGVIASRRWAPRGRRTRACVRSPHAENREGPRSPARRDGGAGRAGKAKAVIP